MMEEDDGAPSGWSSPSKSKRVKISAEDESKELLKDEDHSEEESKEIEDDDEDRPPPGWQQQSPPSSPLLLDMIDLPLPSPLPPTPPLPSSPGDLDMEQQESEDEGPPPGWDNKYQLQEEPEQLVTPTAILVISSDIKTEDGNEEGSAPKLFPLDIQVEEQDSEDEGPPPGWDYKCQPKPSLQTACPTTPLSDIKMEDVLRDARNEEGPQPQSHPSQSQKLVPSDINVDDQDSEDEGPPPGWDSTVLPESNLQIVCRTTTRSDIKVEEQDSEDEGPPPGWDSKILPELNLQAASPTTTRSDMKVEERDSEDEGPPPGWESKILPEPNLQTDVKTEDLQQDDRNGDGSQPRHPSPASELVPLDLKVEEKDSEDEGPPPGWDSKCETEPKLQTAHPRLDSRIEDDEEDDEGPPPGWGSNPQQQPPIHPSGARNGCEQKNVKVIEESPQPPSILPVNNPEMGQMVCGSCRRLLSYPKGARYVECACCLEENYVLQEHEVGQVICGGCNVLLMYPYGAPKVRCANCSTETEIGDQNQRPPLSEHQRRARRHLKAI